MYGEPLLILLHFLLLRAYCALQRDAVQIVKELFVLGRTGPFRENDALLIHQLNGRRSKDSNDLSARVTRVLPCHDDGPSPKPRNHSAITVHMRSRTREESLGEV